MSKQELPPSNSKDYNSNDLQNLLSISFHVHESVNNKCHTHRLGKGNSTLVGLSGNLYNLFVAGSCGKLKELCFQEIPRVFLFSFLQKQSSLAVFVKTDETELDKTRCVVIILSLLND